MGLASGLLPALYKGATRELAPEAQRVAVHKALMQLAQRHGSDWLEEIPAIRTGERVSNASFHRGTREIGLNDSLFEPNQDRHALLRALSHETTHLRDALAGEEFSPAIPYWLKPSEQRAYTQSVLDLTDVDAELFRQPWLLDETERRMLAENLVLPWMETKQQKLLHPSYGTIDPVDWRSLRPIEQMKLPFPE